MGCDRPRRPRHFSRSDSVTGRTFRSRSRYPETEHRLLITANAYPVMKCRLLRFVLALRKMERATQRKVALELPRDAGILHFVNECYCLSLIAVLVIAWPSPLVHCAVTVVTFPGGASRIETPICADDETGSANIIKKNKRNGMDR